MDAQQPRNGRPKQIQGPGATVSSWLPAKTHDRLIQLAKQREDGSVSGTVRDILERATARTT